SKASLSRRTNVRSWPLSDIGRTPNDLSRVFQCATLAVCDIRLHLGSYMKRREFITLLGSATVVFTVAARGQSPKLPTIGFLGTVAQSSWTASTASFEARLHELGWIEGRNIAPIDYRWADGRNDRIAEIAAEFVRLKVDVIVTGGNAVLT